MGCISKELVCISKELVCILKEGLPGNTGDSRVAEAEEGINERGRGEGNMGRQ